MRNLWKASYRVTNYFLVEDQSGRGSKQTAHSYAKTEYIATDGDSIKDVTEIIRSFSSPDAIVEVLECTFLGTVEQRAEPSLRDWVQAKNPDDIITWIVNDNAELGVRIGGRCLFLYKGECLEYKDRKHDDGTPMKVRKVGKKEFGECCLPDPWRSTVKPSGTRYTEGEGWTDM